MFGIDNLLALLKLMLIGIGLVILLILLAIAHQIFKFKGK